MNSKPPIADPHSTGVSRKQEPRIPRAKGAALVALILLGCLAFACGLGIVAAVVDNGVEPLVRGNVKVIDWMAVVGTFFAAVVGILCCWGGLYILYLAFGNEWKNY